MGWYVGRRLIEILPVFFGVLLVVLAISHLTPGDPVLIALGEHATPAAVENVRAELQLNDPLPAQSVKYLGRVLHWEQGRAIPHDERTTAAPAQRAPATISLQP